MDTEFFETDRNAVVSRRTALGLGGAGFAALAVDGLPTTASEQTATHPPESPRPEQGLRVATCQFPVSGDIAENSRHIRDFLFRAAQAGAQAPLRSAYPRTRKEKCGFHSRYQPAPPPAFNS